MPRRLAITAPFVVEVIPYDEPPLQPHQVRVRSELASAKHGTNVSLFEGIPAAELESILGCLGVRDRRYRRGDALHR